MTKQDRLKQINKKLEDSYKTLPMVTKPEDTVPGEGNPDAEIFFIGEAAGRNEAIQRRPFVGVAGKLVNLIQSGDKAFSAANRKRVEISDALERQSGPTSEAQQQSPFLRRPQK